VSWRRRSAAETDGTRAPAAIATPTQSTPNRAKDGHVEDGKAICPLHAWDFDLRTGISPFNPADTLPNYPVRVRDGAVEVDADGVPTAPARPMAYLGEWTRRGATDRGMYLVHHLAEGGGAFVEAMGSERNEPGMDARPFPSYDDIVFRPAQLDRLPLLGDVAVATSVVLGTRAARPLRLDIPLFVNHMSYGALSPDAKEALARGASAAGTAIASGEGGPHPRERAHADRYIFEMASGYFGWSEDNIRAASAIEVKLGQGAKPGLGGTLLGSKVTAEIAAVRGVEAGADYLTVDGLGGGTGAAPVHVKDHVGIPSAFGLYRARRFLDDQGVSDVQLVATGGFRTPDEMAKALALGADAVALATASLMAIGCQQYRACHSGGCPVGIATQNPRLRDRLDVEESARRLTRFLDGATAMMVDYARICGRDSLAKLERSDLATLDPELARRTDLE